MFVKAPRLEHPFIILKSVISLKIRTASSLELRQIASSPLRSIHSEQCSNTRIFPEETKIFESVLKVHKIIRFRVRKILTSFSRLYNNIYVRCLQPCEQLQRYRL